MKFQPIAGPKLRLAGAFVLCAQASSSLQAGTMTSLSAPSHRMAYIENMGQWDGRVRYMLKGLGSNVWLTGQGARYQFIESKPLPKSKAFPHERHRSYSLELDFVGGRPLAFNSGRVVPGMNNYLVPRGRKIQEFRARQYECVESKNVYPGIDVRFSATNLNPRYDLIVNPGADPNKIAIRFDGVKSMHRRSSGAIELTTPMGALVHKGLVAYQSGSEGNQQVACQMTCEGNTLKFHPGKYDHTKPLVIDPVISGTFFGTGSESVRRVAGIQGKVIIAGTTSSLAFPNSLGLGGDVVFTGGTTGYISVLTADLTSVIYSTWFGAGSNSGDVTELSGIMDAVMDSQGRVDFLASDSFTDMGQNDFSVRLNQLDPNGHLLQSGLVSDAIGAGPTSYSLAVSPSGTNVAVAGRDGTGGNDTWKVFSFGVTGFLHSNSTDLFTNSVSPELAGIAGVCIDDAGSIALCGEVLDPTYPTTSGVFMPTPPVGVPSNGFITVLNPDLSIRASTFVSGATSHSNHLSAISPDGRGGFAAVGLTDATDFPSTGVQKHIGGTDALVVDLSGDLTHLLASTYVGGSAEDDGLFLQVVPDGSIYVGGLTASTNFPVKFETDSIAGGNGFVSHLSQDLKTFLHSFTWQAVSGFWVDNNGTFFVGGTTQGVVPIGKDALQRTAPGATSVYVSSIAALPEVTGLTVAPSSIFGSQTAVGTLFLRHPVGNRIANVSVNLKSNSGLVVVPPFALILPGQDSANFSITTLPVTAQRTVTIQASSGTTSASASIVLVPGSFLGGTITSDRPTISSGSKLTITLGISAPLGFDLPVRLSASSKVVPVPASVTIPKGSKSVSVTVQTLPVNVDASVRIFAHYFGVNPFKDVTVSAPFVTSFNLTPSSVVAGHTLVGRINLSGLTGPLGQTITLSTTSTFAQVPASVKVLPGTNTIAFNVTTSGVPTSSVATIKSIDGAQITNASLTVTPAGLSTFTLAPGTVKGGTNVVGKITLTGFAPPGGLVVNLSSSNAGVASVPAQVTVPAHTSVFSFTIKTFGVTASRSVTLTAKQGSSTVSAGLTVTP